MAMAGSGCFIGWYDLIAGGDAEHDHWHTHEHMIERVAIPGFLRGARYRALDGGPRVCVVYQGAALKTFVSPAYLERLNNPTPWSQRCLPLFVGMNRTLCTVAATHGHGIGGTLLTIRLSPRDGEADRLKSWLVGQSLPELAGRPGLCGAHLLIADAPASQTGSQEKLLRGTPDLIADWVVLVEAYDRAVLEGVRAGFEGPDGLAAHGAAAGYQAGLYGLDFTIGEDEAKKIWRGPET